MQGIPGGGRPKMWHCMWTVALLWGALPGCQAFLPNFWSRVLTMAWDSYTHQYMTEQAILNVTMDTLREFTGNHLTSDAEEQTGLGRGFWRAVGEVVRSNAAMDFLSSRRSDPVYHFDSERVEGATETLRAFWARAVALTEAAEFQGARDNLGQLLHTLQDFYSHSNWVDMGQGSVYAHLLDPTAPAIPVATEDTPTCAGCHRTSCHKNLLHRLILGQQKPLLTTGYFSNYPPKPAGKCSHGGVLDSSRFHGAAGGINKDSTSPLLSPHHYLHKEAARLASMATLTVLQDLRDMVGPKSFLRLFSVWQPPALVFVMDTTGSMFEEITAARMRALSIIQARARSPTPSLPGSFLLVPFHDPGVGPVYETNDPELFLRHMENLTALGGGDEPEMCLSAILLALTHSPPLSEIFIFTDASPKDAHLYGAVKALTLEKQSRVTFLLTEDVGGRGRGRRRRRRETLAPDRFSLYSALSSVSGGRIVFTTNKDILKVSVIVQDSTECGKVTLQHEESEPGPASSHAFRVDQAMRDVTLHLTTQSTLTLCDLQSPTGGTQSLLGTAGGLATLDRSQGLYRVSLVRPVEPGVWQLTIRAQGPVTFSAMGDSSLDFLYYFAVVVNETHPGLARVEGSPVAGVPTFLVISVIGISPNEKASFSHVTLMGPNGESLQRVWLNSSSSWWSGEELVGHLPSLPKMPFSLRLSGADGRGNTLERVSTEIIQATHVQIQVFSAPNLAPGRTSSVLYEAQNHGPARDVTISAEDDCGYLSHSGSHRLSIEERGSVGGAVELKVPAGAKAGQAVTLTLIITALDSMDSNYAVVHLTVLPEEPDTWPPLCSPMHVERTCPQPCSWGNWSISLVVRDRGSSGLASIQLTQGAGTATLLLPAGKSLASDHQQGAQRTGSEQALAMKKLVHGDPPLNVWDWGQGMPFRLGYSASCCAPQAELLLRDAAGNSHRCHLTSSQQRAQESNGATGLAATSLLAVSLLCLWVSGTDCHISVSSAGL